MGCPKPAPGLVWGLWVPASNFGPDVRVSAMPKILLVDDNPSMRTIPRLLLRKWGYEVFEASDGQEALDILEREPIGMVISDWMMPNLSGIELCRKIRYNRQIWPPFTTGSALALKKTTCESSNTNESIDH